MPVSWTAWKSRKIRRKVRSSLGAECAAMSSALEHTDLIRIFWAELVGDLVDLEQYEEYLKYTDALAVSDCKSLADAMRSAGSAASKTSEDQRLGVELTMIKQRLRRSETSFQWVENPYMIADVLTKGLQRGNVELLHRIAREGRFTLKPTEEMLARRAEARFRKIAEKTGVDDTEGR